MHIIRSHHGHLFLRVGSRLLGYCLYFARDVLITFGTPDTTMVPLNPLNVYSVIDYFHVNRKGTSTNTNVPLAEPMSNRLTSAWCAVKDVPNRRSPHTRECFFPSQQSVDG